MAILQALLMGAGMVNFNIRALGGNISYFQSLSILGYSLFPLLFATVILKILTLFEIKYMPVIMITEFAATFWAILCTLPPIQPPARSSSSTSTPRGDSWPSYPSLSSTSTSLRISFSIASTGRRGIRAEISVDGSDFLY